MKNFNDLLMRLTADMPMKQINMEKSICEPKELVPKTAFNVIEHGNFFTFESAYIQRYYAGTFRNGSDLWLHRFLSNDGDRHLHSHPFEFQSVMLNGGYTEEFIAKDGSKDHRITLPNPNSQLPELLEELLIELREGKRLYSFTFLSLAHHHNSLDVFDWHRIAAVNNETWTAVIVEPRRLPKWFFKSDDGDLQDIKASPREWWKDYKVRPESGIATDDNSI